MAENMGECRGDDDIGAQFTDSIAELDRAMDGLEAYLDAVAVEPDSKNGDGRSE
jgi:hypothetical protein